MTKDEIIKKLEFISWCYGLVGENERAINEAIEIVRVAQEAERNEPLTLDELMEMDGEPVWVVNGGPFRKKSRWCIVEVDRAEGKLYVDVFDTQENQWSGELYRQTGELKDYDEWRAYRRPLKITKLIH